MKSSEGRLNIYKILKENEIIEPYLLPTVLFKRKAFEQLLQQHLVIRPCHAFSKVSVSSVKENEERYHILKSNISTVLTGKLDVYQYLTKICNEDRFYILQDMNFLNDPSEVVEFFVTVVRGEDSKWSVASIHDKNGSSSKWVLHFLQNKIQHISTETAVCLEQHYPECAAIVLEIGKIKGKLWIQDINLHFPKSKWGQYQMLNAFKGLSPYLPNTELFTQKILFESLKKYKEIMLKPCKGQLGRGIVKISALEGAAFGVHNEKRKSTIKGKNELLDYLHTHFLYKDAYIVQERINLATIEGSLFDIRVMVQRENTTTEWEITGKLVKVASNNFTVTNVAKSLLLVEDALQKSSIENIPPDQLFAKVDEICLLAAEQLERYFQEITFIGMDVGIDDKGRIKLIETNLYPDISIFKRLHDQSMYERIINIGRNLEE
ncbi:YheC/YheD family protein [Schinkia sp. CFF1]